MPGRLLRTADFQAVLKCPPRTRSAHFAVHHLQASPQPRRRAPATELSTGDAPVSPQPVDDFPAAQWLGTVVPKRHAPRAVTRNLLKRQMHASFAHHAAALPPGLWVLRLRAGFARAQWPSAASPALKAAARAELAQLLAGAASAAGAR